MKAYKGFDKNLKCRNFQFEVGGEYEEKNAKLCDAGFHACENPLNVFNYYNPADSRYCEVELKGLSGEESPDSKVCGKQIKIGVEIGLKGLIEAGVKFILEKIDWSNSKESNTGNYSAATNTGHHSAATNTGYHSAATNTGYRSAATNTGDRSAATNTGYRSAATNTGYRSAATNTGNYSAASVEGKGSVAIAIGYESKAKGALGCGICVAERDDDYNLIAIKAAIIDGKKLKPDTYYTLKNGKFVEVKQDE